MRHVARSRIISLAYQLPDRPSRSSTKPIMYIVSSAPEFTLMPQQRFAILNNYGIHLASKDLELRDKDLLMYEWRGGILRPICQQPSQSD